MVLNKAVFYHPHSLTNDLLKKLGRLEFGVHVGCDGREVGVPALAFADDIALVTPTPNVYITYYFG